MKLKAPDAAAATARSPINCFSGISFVAFLTIIYASSAVAKTGAGGLNPAEEWVVARATAGEIADLSKQFPEETDRKLSAHFLEGLLTGTLPGVKLHRHGVRIIGAIIDEPIDLENAQIPCEIWLVCQFNEDVNFARANFARTVSFENSAFKADANFNTMKIGGVAFFPNAVFEGPVDFASADMAGNLEADGTQFQNKENGASFSGMKVRGYAVFNDAVFEGPVDFAAADIGSNFEAQGAKFQNKENEANFNSMKVGHTAFFKKAVFEGPVDFGSADIGSEFGAQGAKFKNGASFSGMKVRGSAFFNDAVFEGPVSFSYADFAWLDLSSPFWPKVAAQFSMLGMSYKYIRAAEEEPESHKALLKLADQSAYTTDVYSNLEEFFYARVTAPMLIALSSRGSVANEKKIFAAWAGLAVTCSIGLSAMDVVPGKLAFPVQFWSH